MDSAVGLVKVSVYARVPQRLYKISYSGILINSDIRIFPVDCHPDGTAALRKSQVAQLGVAGNLISFCPICKLHLTACQIAGSGQLVHSQVLHTVHGAFARDNRYDIAVGYLCGLLHKGTLPAHIAQGLVIQVQDLGIQRLPCILLIFQ